MVIGTAIVISLYLLADVAYLVTLPLEAIQHAPVDRVGTAMLRATLPGARINIMALAIMISTFGFINGPDTHRSARVLRHGLSETLAGRLKAANVIP